MEAITFPRIFVYTIVCACFVLADFRSLSAQGWPMGTAPIATVVGMSRQPTAVRTQNFIIICSDPTFANRVAQAAEHQRQELAVYWLGAPLAAWPQPCPITVVAGNNLGAGGSTTFTPGNKTIRNWRMNVSGSQERILDSVLPHEITHTILATHFAPMNKTVPRWADEGACTTIEHGSERSKHDQFLVRFLSSGRGIPFATMFTLKEYPADIMPLYAQGYSVTSFLIAQGGPKHFVKFLEAGMRTEDWVLATEEHYGYPMIGKLQTAWNKWVYDGGGDVARHTADALAVSKRARNAALASTPAANNTRLVADQTSPQVEPIRVASTTVSTSKANSVSGVSANNESSWYRAQLNKTMESEFSLNGSTQSTVPRDPPSLNDSLSASNGTPLSTEASLMDVDYSVGHQQSPQSIGQPIYR